MLNIFEHKNVLVTGGTGSIGSEIVRKISQYQPKVIRILSNDENGQFRLEQEMQNHPFVRFTKGYPNIRLLVGDVRDKERLKRAMEGIDFVFHAAALKHVPLCEFNPFEAVKTNVLGTQNVIETAMDEEVEKLITISTDKATNPVSVMGATKLLAERLTISANYYKGARRTAFSCVRFGNVLNSRGSVVPLFSEQIKMGGPIAITNPDMTRFVMSLPKAVELVLKAAGMSKGGEIFIFKMPALRIGDLAKVMIEELATQYGRASDSIKIEITGSRPGEKNYEELMIGDEALNTIETEAMFIVGPWFRKHSKIKQVSVKRYTSNDVKLLTKQKIKRMLREGGLLY